MIREMPTWGMGSIAIGGLRRPRRPGSWARILGRAGGSRRAAGGRGRPAVGRVERREQAPARDAVLVPRRDTSIRSRKWSRTPGCAAYGASTNVDARARRAPCTSRMAVQIPADTAMQFARPYADPSLTAGRKRPHLDVASQARGSMQLGTAHAFDFGRP